MFPRPPFVPEWLPDWLLIASTLLVAAALVAAIWWRFVRPARRRRRAEVLFWTLVAIGSIFTAAVMDATVTRESSFGRHGIQVELARRDGERDGTIARVVFGSERSYILGRRTRRFVTIVIIPAHVHIDGPGTLFPQAESVAVTLYGAHVMDRRADELLEPLWRCLDEPDEPCSRHVWQVLRGSRLAREEPELAGVLDQYEPR